MQRRQFFETVAAVPLVAACRGDKSSSSADSPITVATRKLRIAHDVEPAMTFRPWRQR